MIRRENHARNPVEQHQQAECLAFNPCLRFVSARSTGRQPQPARSVFVKIRVPRRNHRDAEPVPETRAELTDVARAREMRTSGANHSSVSATRPQWRHIDGSNRRSSRGRMREGANVSDRDDDRAVAHQPRFGPACTESSGIFRRFAHASMACVVCATPFAS